jgi:hypothetical protein
MPKEPPIPDHQELQTAVPRSERGCRLVTWKPWPFPNSSLIGHADVGVGGLIVHRVPVFRRGDGTLSVGVPNAPEVDADGCQKVRDDGKRQYWSVLSFASGEARSRWNRLVLAALSDAGIGGAS